MQPDPAGVSQLVASLTRVRQGVLLLLAACAVVIAVGSAGGPGDAAATAPRAYTLAALLLALGAILMRQAAASAAPRTGLRLLLSGLLLAGGIGLVGVSLALRVGARNTALAYVLGAAILCLRPPGRRPVR